MQTTPHPILVFISLLEWRPSGYMWLKVSTLGTGDPVPARQGQLMKPKKVPALGSLEGLGQGSEARRALSVWNE